MIKSSLKISPFRLLVLRFAVLSTRNSNQRPKVTRYDVAFVSFHAENIFNDLGKLCPIKCEDGSIEG